MKKLTFLIAILFVSAMVLAACQAPAAPAGPAAPAAPEVKKVRVAFVSPSNINDLAFTQSISDAMKVLVAEMGADKLEYVYSENLFVVDDAAAALRDYASQGFDLVIGHGSQYGSSVQEIAKDFPNTTFAWGTAKDTSGIPNIFSYDAQSNQGGYVFGVMAAKMTKSKVIGIIGPIETGDAKLYVDGFTAGVLSVDPTIQVLKTYTGSFSDVALASEAATTQIAAGADVLTGSAQMVVGAIGKAQEAGIYWFGTQSDQATYAPNTVVASQVYHWEVVLREIITKRAAGTLGGEFFSIDLANKGLSISVNPAIALSDEVKAALTATVDGIVSGTITKTLP
jgi:basic membrane lipoprotein Med (substrate-binding protein (PBP1-ABC) superfamily)